MSREASEDELASDDYLVDLLVEQAEGGSLVQKKEQKKEPASVGLLEVHKKVHDETVGETSQGVAGAAVGMASAMCANLAQAVEGV